jgi:hypothetical protein
MRTQLIKTLALSVGLIAATATPAFADALGFASTTPTGVETRVEATGNATAPTSGHNSVPQRVCTSAPLPNDPALVFDTPSGPKPIYDATHSADTGSWNSLSCTDAAGINTVQVLWAPKVNPATLAQQAIASADLPTPQISTSPPQSAGAVVNVPTWLWVNVADWRTVSATANVAGYAVTATATPSSVNWNMGDGKTVACNGPGVPYDTSVSDAAQHSDCTYLYSQSSANQPNHAYAVAASVTWAVTWKATDGTQGQLNSIIRTNSVAMPVREIQTINVAPNGGW